MRLTTMSASAPRSSPTPRSSSAVVHPASKIVTCCPSRPVMYSRVYRANRPSSGAAAGRPSAPEAADAAGATGPVWLPTTTTFDAGSAFRSALASAAGPRPAVVCPAVVCPAAAPSAAALAVVVRSVMVCSAGARPAAAPSAAAPAAVVRSAVVCSAVACSAVVPSASARSAVVRSAVVRSAVVRPAAARSALVRCALLRRAASAPLPVSLPTDIAQPSSKTQVGGAPVFPASCHSPDGLGHVGWAGDIGMAGPSGCARGRKLEGSCIRSAHLARMRAICVAYRRTPVSIGGLLSVIAGDPALRQALGAGPAAETGGDFTAPPALRPFLAAALTGLPGERGKQTGQDRRFVLAVTASAREAEALTDALTSLLPADGVAYFPAWETLPHERISPGPDTSGRRLAVLRRLAHPDPASPRTGPLRVVVTSVRGLLQPIVGGLGDIAPVSLRPGQAIGLDEVIAGLVDIGYTRTDLVERRGEIAVRGGIVDVFPPTEEHPLRVEFFGDEVEEIRQFRVADQRSLQTVDELWVPPCRELLLTPAVRERAKQLAADHPGLADVLGKLADGIAVEGMEAFAPAIASRMELLLDHVPAGGRVLACDPERIRARAADLVRTSQEFLAASWVNAAAGGQVPIDLGAAAFRSITQVRAASDRLGLPWWTITPFESPGAVGADEAAQDGYGAGGRGAGGRGDGRRSDGRRGDGRHGDGRHGDGAPAAADEDELGRPAFRIGASPAEGYGGDTARALADVRRWLAAQWRVVLITEGHGPAQRLAEMLRADGLGARLGDLDDPPEPGVPHVTTGLIANGFTWEAARLAVISEADLAGQRTGSRDTRRMPSRRRGGIDPLQLTPGDYVVHEQHGVGRYLEMTSRSVQGAVREYLVIEYAPGKRGQPPDRLYVPTD